MLGRTVLKQKSIPELEKLITSLKALPDAEIELSVDAGFFDRNNPVFAKRSVTKGKKSAKVTAPSEGLVTPVPTGTQEELRALVREKLKERGLSQQAAAHGPKVASKILPVLGIINAA